MLEEIVETYVIPEELEKRQVNRHVFDCTVALILPFPGCRIYDKSCIKAEM